ncbi:hypothetical protein Tco_1475209, partial [Tanacetum coccineum]
ESNSYLSGAAQQAWCLQPWRVGYPLLMLGRWIVVGEIDPYLGGAAQRRACSNGGSHTLLSCLALANLIPTTTSCLQPSETPKEIERGSVAFVVTCFDNAALHRLMSQYVYFAYFGGLSGFVAMAGKIVTFAVVDCTLQFAYAYNVLGLCFVC